MIFLGFPPNLADFDPVIIEKDQIEQKGNGFLQSISSGTYITFTSSKLFNIFFLSGIDTPLKSFVKIVPYFLIEYKDSLLMARDILWSGGESYREERRSQPPCRNRKIATRRSNNNPLSIITDLPLFPPQPSGI